MSIATIHENDPYKFPGTNGTPIQIKSNLFKYVWNKDSIGMSNVRAWRTKLDQRRTVQEIPLNQIFRLLKTKFQPLGYQFISGFPNGDYLTIYSIPPFEGGKRYSNNPSRDGNDEVVLYDAEEFDQRSFQRNGNNAAPISIVTFEIKYLGKINPYIHINDSEPAQFLKKVVMHAIGESMCSYTLIKNKILASKHDFATLPIAKIDFVKNVVTGMKMCFHPELRVPVREHVRAHKNDENASLVSINSCSTIVTRTNVSIFQYYAVTVLRRAFNETHFNLEDFKGRSMTNEAADKLLKLVEGLDVYIDGDRQYRGSIKHYKIIGITEKPASKILIFDKKLNRDVGINDFWGRITKRRIILPDQRAALLETVGKNNQKITVPLELVIISDRPQRVEGNSQKYRDALVKAALPPKERFEAIETFVAELVKSIKENEVLKKIGMNITKKGIEIDGRLLEPPLLTDKTTIYSPYNEKVVDYILFVFDDGKDEKSETNATKMNIERLIEKFMIYGITFGKCIFRRKSTPETSVERMKDLLTKFKQKPEYNKDNRIIFFVITDIKDTQVYGRLKKVLHEAGYPSQFLTNENLSKTASDKHSLAFNLAIKINAKLGGHRINVDDANEFWKNCMNPNEPTMLIGIDTRLSIKKERLGRVAVVTSTDPTGLNYRAFVKVCDGFGKYSTDLSDIIREAFEEFKGRTPNRMLIYRAGMNVHEVTTGTGEATIELNNIRECLSELYDKGLIDVIPKIAYIAYNRAHNIRFKRTDEPIENNEDDDDDSIHELTQNEKEEREKTKYNVPIGTVIDSQIVDENTFYLITHCAVVGTTKPAKYIIVKDEWPMTANDMLGFTYTLCNMSPRSKKSIKRPLPIHLAALLLEKMYEMYPEQHERSDAKKELKINKNLKDKQFYV